MSIVGDILKTQEFATLPQVASKILALIEDDDVDIRVVSKVIESDAPLTLKILRVANSPLYATRSEVNSIHQAIMKLGLNRLTNIVLGVSIFSKFLMGKNKKANELLEKFWWHTSCTGMIAKSITIKIQKFFKENEFIGGLIHDIGKLALIQYDTDKYLAVIEKIESGMLDIDAEREIFGTDHIEIGYEIAKLWKLPNELVAIIRFHTNPAEADSNKDLISIVRLADKLSEIWGADFYEGIEMVKIEDEEPWEILCNHFEELRELDLEKFTFELENDFKNSKEFLNILKDSRS
jgi:HD-like signal output (HDOD) protein